MAYANITITVTSPSINFTYNDYGYGKIWGHFTYNRGTSGWNYCPDCDDYTKYAYSTIKYDGWAFAGTGGWTSYGSGYLCVHSTASGSNTESIEVNYSDWYNHVYGNSAYLTTSTNLYCTIYGNFLGNTSTTTSGYFPLPLTGTPTFTLTENCGIDAVVATYTGGVSSTQNEYQLWRATTSGGTYSLVDTSSTTTMEDYTVVNGTWWYKIRAVNQEWESNYSVAKSIVYTCNTVNVTTSPMTSLGFTGANGGGDVTDGGGSPVTARGVCWNDSGTPTTGDTYTTDGTGEGAFTSYLTGLTSDTTYYVRAYAVNTDGIAYGAEINFDTLSTPEAPSGVTITDTLFSYFDVTWVNNSDGGQGDYNSVQYYDGAWQEQTALLTASAHTITGLTHNTEYPIRVALVDTGSTYYYSSEISGTTLSISAPSALTSTVESFNYVGLGWTNNSASEGVKVYYKKSVDSTWSLFETVGSGDTTSTVLGLVDYTSYDFKISSYYDTSEFDSNIITVETDTFPLPFCEGVNYSVTGATCGNADGILGVTDNDYSILYDFELTDQDGNLFVISQCCGLATGLTANWYFLTATPKSTYWSVYGQESCTVGWIELLNTSSSVVITRENSKVAQCGPFDIQQGRLQWTVSGSSTTYSLYVYSSSYDGEPLYSSTGNTETTLVYSPKDVSCYYAKIVSEDDDCITLSNQLCLDAEAISSIGGIKRLFVTNFNTDLEYDYWKSSDDSFYVESEDTSSFLSTKIARYYSDSGGTLTWYGIPVLSDMSLSQNLAKTRQGFVLTDLLNVSVPKMAIDRFTDFTALLPNKWVYVIEDGNGYWFTGGFQVGASIESFIQQTAERGSADNKYTFSFKAISSDKLLTALDAEWVQDNILT